MPWRRWRGGAGRRRHWRCGSGLRWPAPRGSSVTDVAVGLEVTRDTVCIWRSRFLADRLEGLRYVPRLAAPGTINGDQVDLVITKTLAGLARPGQTALCSIRLMSLVKMLSSF